MSISVILADDHEIIREGIKSLLDNENDIEVIAQCENGLEIVDLATKLNIEDSSLRRIESGRNNPTIITLKKVADALEVQISEIINVNNL